MDTILSIKTLDVILKDFKLYHQVPRDPGEFLELVGAVGIKMIGKIDRDFLNNEDFVKRLINKDPYSLFYIGEEFHQEKYFKEVNRRHEVLLLNPINRKLSNSTINWIVNNCEDYVRFEFFKKPFPQLNQENSLLRQRLGVGFLINGLMVPKYLQSDVQGYMGKDKQELLEIKKTLLSYEKIEEMLTYEKLNVRIRDRKTKI